MAWVNNFRGAKPFFSLVLSSLQVFNVASGLPSESPNSSTSPRHSNIDPVANWFGMVQRPGSRAEPVRLNVGLLPSSQIAAAWEEAILSSDTYQRVSTFGYKSWYR